MKPISELTDEGLALAVVIEVLPKLIENNDGMIEVLAPQGRHAIEDECVRRGWDVALFYSHDVSSWVANVEKCVDGIFLFEFEVFEKNRYRAIAEAALMAVREEGEINARM